MPLTADSLPIGGFIGFAVIAMFAVVAVATLISGASRTSRFWLCLVLSILLAFGLLFGDGMLVQIGPPPWEPATAALFVTGVYLVPCSIQALLLGLFAGRPAVRWIFGTIAITGVVVIAITLLVLASAPQNTRLWTGLGLLMATTLLSGLAWLVILRNGWLKDTGAPPWDLQKSRSTFLGRFYLPPQEPLASPRQASGFSPASKARLPIEVLRDELIAAARLRIDDKADRIVEILLTSPLSRVGLADAIDRIAAADIDGVSSDQLVDIAAQLRGLMSAWPP